MDAAKVMKPCIELNLVECMKLRLPPDIDLSNKITPLQAPTLDVTARLKPGAGEWLRRTAPVAIVGHSLYVYDVGAR